MLRFVGFVALLELWGIDGRGCWRRAGQTPQTPGVSGELLRRGRRVIRCLPWLLLGVRNMPLFAWGQDIVEALQIKLEDVGYSSIVGFDSEIMGWSP